MNKFKKAFSLVELAIYLGLFSIFTLLGFGFFSKNYKSIIFEMSENRKNLRNISFINLLRRDLFQADSSLVNWDINNFVFQIIITDYFFYLVY